MCPDRPDVVVGAGLAGLSAAMRLRGAGRAVRILEAADEPGGLARPLNLAEFQLDGGPTVLTVPDILRDAFDALGVPMERYLELVPVDPAYRIQFADGSHLDLTTDEDEMASRIGTFASTADATGYRRLVAMLREMFATELPAFIDRNFDHPLQVAGPALVTLTKLGGFRRLDRLIGSYLRDERLRRAYSFQALYAGLSPHRALGMFAVITAMDVVEGVWYPRGGMSAIPRAMAAALRDAGVEIEYGRPATAVTSTSSGAQVRFTYTESDTSDDGLIDAENVVLAMEPERAATLVPAAKSSRRTVRLYAPSAALLVAGVHGKIPVAAHHTVSIGHRWQEVFDDLRSGRLMRDPSFLVSVPTLTDPDLAPPGDSVLYALFPAPNTQAGATLDWARLRDIYRATMLVTMQDRGFGDLESRVLTERFVTPADWLSAGHAAGTPFSAAHTFGQSGPFRTGNRLTERVVLAGAGTTPGIGVPMVVLSGRLAAERIVGRASDYSSRAWRSR